MSTLIHMENAADYPHVIDRVLRDGTPRVARDMATVDLGHTTVIIKDPYRCIPVGLGRNLDTRIAALEAIQLIAGVADPALTLRIAPQFEQYANTFPDGEKYFHGAYGDRIMGQASCAVQKIKTDPGTRQAVITLWDPWRDNVLDDIKDFPCTIGASFNLSRGALQMHTVMRSNDVWLGFPYDIFQFTQLQLSMAKSLIVHPGAYRHTAMSFHLYERDEDKAKDLVESHRLLLAPIDTDAFLPRGIGYVGMPFSEIMDRARSIMKNTHILDETPSERWYREQLHKRSSHVG